jgi:hypothetical protein
MNAFSPETIASDLSQLRLIFEDFFEPLTWADWKRPTGSRPQDWTLKQTLIHVAAVAEWFYRMIDDTLEGEPVEIPGLKTRADLRAVNAREIEDQAHVLPEVLVERLLDTLEQTATRVSGLTPEQLALAVPAPFYNRPMTVSEVFGSQLSHAGIVHAGQLAKGANSSPVWERYTPEMMCRQVARFFAQFSHSYWPERGGDLRAAINFNVGGCGLWQVTVAPDGGTYGQDALPQADLTIWTRSADVFCRLMTMQLRPLVAAVTGQAFAWPNPLFALRLLPLFTPT